MFYVKLTLNSLTIKHKIAYNLLESSILQKTIYKTNSEKQ